MKIVYSIKAEYVESDNKSHEIFIFPSYSLLDILHGIGSSYIILIFNYWKQDLFLLDGGILAFLYNIKGELEDLKSKIKVEANIFSLEQGYSLQMKMKGNQVLLSGFNREYTVELNKLESALQDVSKRACKEIELLYPEIKQNNYFEEIKSHLGCE